MGGSLHVYLGPRGEIGPPCGRRKTSDDRLDQVMCQSGAIDISFRLNFSQEAPQEAPRKRSRRKQPYHLEKGARYDSRSNNGTGLMRPSTHGPHWSQDQCMEQNTVPSELHICTLDGLPCLIDHLFFPLAQQSACPQSSM